MASVLQKYLRSEYSHSVHGGVSSLLGVVSSATHQHAPQEHTALPGPSLGTIPHTTGPSSTVHCRPPWQCSAAELWLALTLYPWASTCLGGKSGSRTQVLQQEVLSFCYDEQASAILRASALPQASTCLGGIVAPLRRLEAHVDGASTS